MTTADLERYEILEEFAQLFIVVQGMGSRLANETHGVSYDKVQYLNQILHEARLTIESIRSESFGSSRILIDRRAQARPGGDLRAS